MIRLAMLIFTTARVEEEKKCREGIDLYEKGVNRSFWHYLGAVALKGGAPGEALA